MDPIVDGCRQMIRKGSRSFAGAARLIPPATRESVYMLYAWCRHCDDRIDQQDLGRNAPAHAGSAAERLEELEQQTRAALRGEPSELLPFRALARVVERHRIPAVHPLELLHGFRMDVEDRRYVRFEETLDYCYHVAGVVGVMMAYVMGARQEEALDRAADLGIGLQLTNIARDVIDDASAGRVYLPQEWLTEVGLSRATLRDSRNRDALCGVVRRLLLEADRYYLSAGHGLRWLDSRSAWAVATARDVYRDIGREVLGRGRSAWDERAYVPGRRKIALALRAGVETFTTAHRQQGSSRDGLWKRPRT